MVGPTARPGNTVVDYIACNRRPPAKHPPPLGIRTPGSLGQPVVCPESVLRGAPFDPSAHSNQAAFLLGPFFLPQTKQLDTQPTCGLLLLGSKLCSCPVVALGSRKLMVSHRRYSGKAAFVCAADSDHGGTPIVGHNASSTA